MTATQRKRVNAKRARAGAAALARYRASQAAAKEAAELKARKRLVVTAELRLPSDQLGIIGQIQENLFEIGVDARITDMEVSTDGNS